MIPFPAICALLFAVVCAVFGWFVVKDGSNRDKHQ